MDIVTATLGAGLLALYFCLVFLSALKNIFYLFVDLFFIARMLAVITISGISPITF